MKSHMLFVIDPLETLHLETDTTFAIMLEASRRGHTVWTCHLEDLRIEKETPHATLTQIHISKDRSWNCGKKRECALEEIPIICMRKDPPFSIDYVMATSLLSLVNSKKTFIMNDPAALRNFNEKLGIFEFPKYIPDTIVSKKYADHIEFLRRHKKVVLKPLEGFGGNEIFILGLHDRNRNSLLEVMTHRQTRYIMAQRYLSEVRRGDLRVLILAGKILGVQKRLAEKDDHRSNISAGGRSQRGTLSEKERRMCIEVGAALAKKGIYFAGIDIIAGYITEINVTSPTGLVKINAHEGAHLERQVVDFLEYAPMHIGALFP